MAKLFYIHWDKDEALAGARGLREAGHSVRYEAEDGQTAWKELKKHRPDALVVSLAKLPTHGRRVAAATMETKSLKTLPVIFVGGEDEMVAQTRKQFPEAVYCSWAQLRDRIQKVMNPPKPAGVAGAAGGAAGPLGGGAGASGSAPGRGAIAMRRRSA
jgi:CheY-like chemotaxis protein